MEQFGVGSAAGTSALMGHGLSTALAAMGVIVSGLTYLVVDPLITGGKSGKGKEPGATSPNPGTNASDTSHSGTQDAQAEDLKGPEPGSQAEAIEGNPAAARAMREAIHRSAIEARKLEGGDWGMQDQVGAFIRPKGDDFEVGRPDPYVISHGREPGLAPRRADGAIGIGAVARPSVIKSGYFVERAEAHGIPIYVREMVGHGVHVFEAGRAPATLP
jgi:hypothetical protein